MARFESNQEVVDYVAVHLKKQGRRARRRFAGGNANYGSHYICSYVTPSKLTCAIGACFEDPTLVEDYAESVIDLECDFPDLFQATFGRGVDPQVLYHLQVLHDKSEDKDGPEAFWEKLKPQFNALCQMYDLELPPAVLES